MRYDYLEFGFPIMTPDHSLEEMLSWTTEGNIDLIATRLQYYHQQDLRLNKVSQAFIQDLTCVSKKFSDWSVVLPAVILHEMRSLGHKQDLAYFMCKFEQYGLFIKEFVQKLTTNEHDQKDITRYVTILTWLKQQGEA